MQGQPQVVYAFIDSQNLYRGVRASGWEIDYLKFRNYLRTKYNVCKAFLFIGYVPKYARLYQYLQECGFILVFKPVLEIHKRNKETYKGNVDGELVLHAMIQFPIYDKCVIVSGDGDFLCLIEHLHANQKLYKILAPNQKYSSLLRDYAAYIVQIDLFRNKVEKK